MSGYEFTCKQLFNVFGAPGIPNTYRATLYRGGREVEHRDFWFWSKAERQCERWRSLFDARPARLGRRVTAACSNCDDRRCMGCVCREWDHDCANDCPECCEGVIYLDALDSVFLEHDMWVRSYWHDWEHLEHGWTQEVGYTLHGIDASMESPRRRR